MKKNFEFSAPKKKSFHFTLVDPFLRCMQKISSKIQFWKIQAHCSKIWEIEFYDCRYHHRLIPTLPRTQVFKIYGFLQEFDSECKFNIFAGILWITLLFEDCNCVSWWSKTPTSNWKTCYWWSKSKWSAVIEFHLISESSMLAASKLTTHATYSRRGSQDAFR